MERLKPSYNQVIDALQDFIWYRNLDKLMAKVEEITLAVPAVEFDPELRPRFIESMQRFKSYEYSSDDDLKKVKKEYEDQLQEYQNAIDFIV